QTISGKAGGEFLAGDVVSFTLNGHAYSAAVNASGDWSVSVPGADLAKETNIHATLVAHDAAGNSANAVADHPYTVIIDPGKVTLSIDTVAGDDIVNLAESQTSQIISGKATGEFKAGDVVSFTLNGHAYSAAVSGSGDWSVSVAGSDLAKETNIHATLVAHDNVGNISSVIADHGYRVDTVPPVATLTINVVAGDDILNLAESQTSQTISGKAGGEFLANDLVTFTLNGTAYSAAVNASGDWSVSVAGADLAKADNIHATLVAHDAAGNSANVVADHGYRVDLVSTTPVITSVYDDVGSKTGNLVPGETTDDARPKISGTAEANSTVTIYDKNVPIGSTTADGSGNWSFTPSTDLAEGTHDITAKAVDVAGNLSAPSNAFDFTVSLAPAAPVITSVYDDVGPKQGNLVPGETTDDARPDINGTSEANRVIYIYDNSERIGSTTANASGNWSYTPAFDLADGAHNIVARADNGAGQLSGVSNAFGFTVNTVPPVPEAPTITSVYDDVGPKQGNLVQGETTDDNRPTINGTSEANRTITIYDKNVVIGSTTSNGSGTWSFTPTTDLANGTHDITAKASDGLGQISAPSNAFGFTVDVVPPKPTFGIIDFENCQVGTLATPYTPVSNYLIPGTTVRIYTTYGAISSSGDMYGLNHNTLYVSEGHSARLDFGTTTNRVTFKYAAVDDVASGVVFWDVNGNSLGSLQFAVNSTPVAKTLDFSAQGIAGMTITSRDYGGLHIDDVNLYMNGYYATRMVTPEITDDSSSAEQLTAQAADSHGTEDTQTAPESAAASTHTDPLGHVVPTVDIAALSDTYYGASESYVALHDAE
ncbi:Ig-like domain-containing protein, partial [Pseudomonas sp. GD03903]|uniref:Ig-like domain-containing protein n=1 Tax=Pseudomonas sp. GD03903 TaxID=2975402 RepID=UPI00244D740D